MASAEPKVVVIGCGISGVAVAQRLVKAGFHHVRILEATARSGGRIQTDRMGTDIVDMGATYIHGPSEENPVFCLARDYGLLDSEALTNENQDIDYQERLPWKPNWFSSSGERLSTEDMTPALQMYNELMDDISQFEDERETPWTSVGHFLRSEAKRRAAEKWEEKDKTTRELLFCGISAMLKMECCASAAHTMDNIDVFGFCMYKSLSGLDCTIQGGFEGLITSLMSELPSDSVSYNRPVRCIHWNNTENGRNSLSVECDDGERIAADHVVVTVSLGYLKKHHSTLFYPQLPAHKLQSIKKLEFGVFNKIYLEFETPWWDADCEVIHLVWTDETDILDHVSDIQKYWIRKMSTLTVHKPSESHVLCGWICGHESEYMESLPEEELTQSITELIRRFTGNPAITPKRILRTQWYHNPWTCGSYFYPNIGCSAKDLENMMEPLPTTGSQSQPLQVLFAGEATHPCYYSTVHGALLSGWREADRLISYYSFSQPSQKDGCAGHRVSSF